MKKVFIVVLFVISFIAAFFITRSLGSKEETGNEPVKIDSVKTVLKESFDISKNTEKGDSLNVNKKEKKVEDKTDKDEIKTEKKPAAISCSDMKVLIMNGSYAKDKRISKNYSVEYDELNDDDADIKNNLQAIRDMVDYENWKDFEVIGLGYDNQGRVNKVTIRPVY